MHFDKLSANGYIYKSKAYPFVLSLSKHERIIFRGSLKKDFIKRGETVPSWAKKNGFKVSAVRNVIYGRAKGYYGESHRIAIALGLKDGNLED